PRSPREMAADDRSAAVAQGERLSAGIGLVLARIARGLMFVIIGYIVVLLAVFGGYAIAGGDFGVLVVAAPLEMVIIAGAAMGAFLVGNNQKVLKATFKAIPTL